MRNTVAVDMTTGGTITAWDCAAENENLICLLVHTGAGANPKIYLENRVESTTVTGFDANSIYFYMIPDRYFPDYVLGEDNYLRVTLSDDSQTAAVIRFNFSEDNGGQMTISKDPTDRLFFVSYQKIMTDAETNEIIQNAQTTIEQLPQTITDTASSSTVANNVNSFNLDGVFESIITNIKPVILKKTQGGYVYVNTPPSNGIRNYIQVKENYIQFIEAHLPSGSTFVENETTAFTLGGQQVYYTSIDGASAYKNLTFTSPTVLNGSDVDVSMYEVRIPTPTATYIKSQYKWTYKSDIDSFVVDLIFGVGDASGNGIYKFSKDANSGSFVYTSRTTGQTIGFKLQDDGVYYTQDGVNWYLVGSGQTGGNVKIIDHAPVNADLTGENTVFAQYDPNSTPALNGTLGTLFNATNVYVEVPAIGAITISPSTVTVKKGKTQQFTASTTVTWTVTGNTSASTTIDANGLLSVGNDESATEIFVTARSTVDTSKYASANVSVAEQAKYVFFDNGAIDNSIAVQLYQSANATDFVVGNQIIRPDPTNHNSTSTTCWFANPLDFTAYSTAIVDLNFINSGFEGNRYDGINIASNPTIPNQYAIGSFIGTLLQTGNHVILNLDISGWTVFWYFALNSTNGYMAINKITFVE